MRHKRLAKDYEAMCRLSKNSELINIECDGACPDKYKVYYSCRSLIWINGNTSPSYSNRHELEIYLHKEYPRKPPLLKWLTSIFHPNILPPQKNGGVCIGWWTPAETLDQLCLRIGEMLQYRTYNLKDPLDEDAASWIKLNTDMLPVDKRSLC